jgi:tetratricopeptide (TPR) repeat protein
MTGEMPANHPPLEGGNATGTPDPSGGAATSPQTQSAMDEADRNPKDFDRQMAAAVAFYNNRAYDKAETYRTRALAVKPNDVDALTGLANTKYDKGDYPAAQGLYEKILAQKKDSDIQTDLGNTFFKRKDFDRAIAEYRKAAAMNPQHEKAWQNIAAAAFQKGDKVVAREAIDKLAAINPQNPALPSLRESLAQ